MPAILLRPIADIGGIDGAFSQSENTIFLAEEFVDDNGDDPLLISKLILQQVGYFVDSVVNTQDAPGNEGNNLFTIDPR